MNFLTTETKVGLFVITATAFLFIMLNMIQPFTFFKNGESFKIITYFNSTSGVEKKSFVRVAGVSVGRVIEIILEHNKAKVVIELDKGVEIWSDSVATVRAQGLLGEKFIEISGGTSSSVLLKDGDILHNTQTPMAMDEAVSKVGEVLEDLKTVSASFRKVFGTEEGKKGLQLIFDNVQSVSSNLDAILSENRIKLSNILSNIERLTDTLDQNKKSLAATIKNFESISGTINKKIPSITDNVEKITVRLNDVLNDENRANLKDTLSTIKEASHRLNSALLSVNEVLDGENKTTIKKIFSNIRQASLKLGETLDEINSISHRINSGEGTVGKLIADEEIYEKMNDALEGINTFVSKAERLKLYVGMRGEYQTEEGEAKSFFTLKLQPREDRYYLVEVTNDVRKNKDKKDVNSLSNLLYTFQFSKKFKDLGLRIGLMESSFGIGSDFFLREDRFKISLDAFNFTGYDTSVTQPQMKFTSQVNFLQYLFAYAGVDEILNKKYRTVFAGIGLTFNDEDLKTILGAIR